MSKREKIKPVFNSKMPQEASRFFEMDSDDDFKAKHPFAYPVLVIIGITVLCLPLFVYVLVFAAVDAGNQDFNALILVGLIGSFMIGVGLFNLVAAFLKQYLGHTVTLVCILGGLLICIISLVL